MKGNLGTADGVKRMFRKWTRESGRVINLSKRELTEEERSVLERGMKFAPTLFLHRRENGKVDVSIYRKPTHTERYCLLALITRFQ